MRLLLLPLRAWSDTLVRFDTIAVVCATVVLSPDSLPPDVLVARGNKMPSFATRSSAPRPSLLLLLLLLMPMPMLLQAASSSCYRTSNYFRTHFNDTSNVLEQPASSKSYLSSLVLRVSHVTVYVAYGVRTDRPLLSCTRSTLQPRDRHVSAYRFIRVSPRNIL